jgi:hypothetical protein
MLRQYRITIMRARLRNPYGMTIHRIQTYSNHSACARQIRAGK